MSVGRVECYLDDNICRSLNISTGWGVEFRYYPGPPVLGGAVLLSGETAQDTANEILALMPELPLISAQEYKVTAWEGQ